jgi:hypothetical protein
MVEFRGEILWVIEVVKNKIGIFLKLLIKLWNNHIEMRFLTSKHLELALSSLFLIEKYTLGVDRNAIFFPSFSHSLTKNSIVALEYQY